MERRAKILATLGPSSADERTIARLLAAGADAFRLNLSHGKRDQHRELVHRVRAVCEQRDVFVPLVFDLMGPRYRMAEFEGKRQLKRNAEMVLGTSDDADLPLDNPEILSHLRVGERVLIDNGMIEVEVRSKRGQRAKVRVLNGGTVTSRKGINLPDTDLPFEISDKDKADIEMAVEEDADYIAVSYVARARDLISVRRVIRGYGGNIPLIAKVERRMALENLDEIVIESAAIMVARGDLGVEVPLHSVPVIQKRMIDAAWRLGKPVIVATQMLESMMEQPRPTRAESSDVANAVFDGADAMMLSGETAAGRYPVKVVKTMARIICEAEEHHQQVDSRSTQASGTSQLGSFDIEPPPRPGTEELPETISSAAVLSARRLGARRIVVLTEGGFTAMMLASRRPSTPVIALTQEEHTARRLQLVWGVRPLRMEGEVAHHDEVVGLVDRHLIDAKLARVGETVAILMGDPIQDRPPTNLLRLHRVRPQRGSKKKGAKGKKV